MSANSDNGIILGDAFLAAFTGIFDVENDRIGLAANARALPGNTMECKRNCGINWIEVIGGFVAITAAISMIVLCVYIRK